MRRSARPPRRWRGGAASAPRALCAQAGLLGRDHAARGAAGRAPVEGTLGRSTDATAIVFERIVRTYRETLDNVTITPAQIDSVASQLEVLRAPVRGAGHGRQRPAEHAYCRAAASTRECPAAAAGGEPRTGHACAARDPPASIGARIRTRHRSPGGARGGAEKAFRPVRQEPAQRRLSGRHAMQSLRRAMISSTTLDLPEHRQRVKTACEAADVLPKMMENLTARDEDAVSTSLSMVDAADIYIGIYGRRYGHVPKGATTSITEMELDRAIERKITILAFLIDPAHLVTADMVETSAAAQRKLERLKQRASAGRMQAVLDGRGTGRPGRKRIARHPPARTGPAASGMRGPAGTGPCRATPGPGRIAAFGPRIEGGAGQARSARTRRAAGRGTGRNGRLDAPHQARGAACRMAA